MIKIIIVDDHQIFLDGLVSVLSKQENIEILFVENKATIALKRIKKEAPDLVITDISMPEMNGLEFIKTLKKDHPEIKILVLSMFSSIQSFDGIDGYLLKECDIQELLDAINGIVKDNKTYFNSPQSKAENFHFNKTILSQREKQLIELIAAEYTTEEIAAKLFISKHTVEAHRKNIFLKLDVKNIAGLIKKAIYLGVIK